MTEKQAPDVPHRQSVQHAGPIPAGKAQSGMSEKAQSASSPAAEKPPHCASAPYRTVSDEQRAIWETAGRRGIGFGLAWLVGGLLVSLITYQNAMDGGVYFIAWGPITYGFFRAVSSYLTLKRSRN